MEARKYHRIVSYQVCKKIGWTKMLWESAFSDCFDEVSVRSVVSGSRILFLGSVSVSACVTVRARVCVSVDGVN